MQYLSTFIYAERLKIKSPQDSHDEIEKSILFMQEHLNETLSHSKLASSVNLSNSHYSAIFKRKTGFPPIEYFNHLKIQKACSYLQFTKLRIKEIAFKLGIDDAFYFSMFF
ncbi:AraC family transcriptional regulator [Pedobacter sp. Leaf216]|uniref:helix-turn-helix domain-containing protein n=1 Tax=Pedobacter sp. Leaf216 TaxID=1735684 RepID=UPI000ACA51A3|nr:AraC family transcriptional regulator [Pedobacter sp. Leaf216]